jgi:hypothetical protein
MSREAAPSEPSLCKIQGNVRAAGAMKPRQGAGAQGALASVLAGHGRWEGQMANLGRLPGGGERRPDIAQTSAALE